MKHIYSLDKYDRDGVAKFRLEVISFYDSFGLNATRQAFKVGRSMVFLWKKRLKEGNGSLLSLTPLSSRPRTPRRMIVDQRILDFIKNLRENNYRIGKEKIKILLDVYCQKENLPLISSSKVGRIIKKSGYFYLSLKKVYHNPNHRWGEGRQKKERVPSLFRSKKEGELLQLDTITKFDFGLKRYILTAVDLYSRFSFAFSYKTLTSQVALDFYEKLSLVAPFKIKSVKTDNGLEFEGDFDNYLRRENTPHYFSYPRTPKSNAFVERFNRTLQEEFVDNNLDAIQSPLEFNQRLVNYLLYYNTVRPHQALGYLTPMAFMLKEGLESKRIWTSTRE